MDLVAELSYKTDDSDNVNEIISQIEKMNKLKFVVFFLGLSTYSPDPKIIKQFILDPSTIEYNMFSRGAEQVEEEDILYFFQHIDPIKKLLLNTMRQYWNEIFKAQWESIDQYVMTVIKRGTSLIERNGAVNYICSLHDDIFVRDGKLVFHKEPGFSIHLEDINEFVITPSVFSEPHLFGNIFRGKVFIALNMNYHAVSVNETIPLKSLEFMHLVSDKTRYRIIKVLWSSEATTKDIAELLTLSPSTVSIHLKLLKDAGLVTVSKSNKFAYYKLEKEPFYHIQENLPNSLEQK